MERSQIRKKDRVLVRYNRAVMGKGEVMRVHRDGTVSVLWDLPVATVDGLIASILTAVPPRYVSRVDASYCEIIGQAALKEAKTIIDALK